MQSRVRSGAPQRGGGVADILGGKSTPASRPTTGKPKTLAPPDPKKSYTSLQPAGRELLDQIRGILKARGSGATNSAISRAFRIHDDDGNSAMNFDEFYDMLERLVRPPMQPTTRLDEIGTQPSQRMLRVASRSKAPGAEGPSFGRRVTDQLEAESSGPTVDRANARALFDSLDYDRSGTMDPTEFAALISPPMNDRRLALVRAAFNILDADGDGKVTTDEMGARYDFSAHPAVRRGAMTRAEALRDFMTQWWDADGDGIITPREFEKYYDRLSRTIVEDDYFELMIRNAWHMQGGVGAASATAGTGIRALVEHYDGTKETVQVTNTLGLRRGDQEELHRRLTRQGVRQIKSAVIVSGVAA